MKILIVLLCLVVSVAGGAIGYTIAEKDHLMRFEYKIEKCQQSVDVCMDLSAEMYLEEQYCRFRLQRCEERPDETQPEE
jgi:hypothetical protein